MPIGVVSLLLYADDVTGLVADVESVKLFFTIVKIFEQYSGLVLNMSKTEALWIGENPSCELNSIGVSCHKQAIKIMFISNDMDLAIDLNLKERINTIRSVINNWKKKEFNLWYLKHL